jgi:hypothetical protein
LGGFLFEDEGKVALDTLLDGVAGSGPSGIVEKFEEGGFEGTEDVDVAALDLLVVDGNACIELLGGQGADG